MGDTPFNQAKTTPESETSPWERQWGEVIAAADLAPMTSLSREHKGDSRKGGRAGRTSTHAGHEDGGAEILDEELRKLVMSYHPEGGYGGIAEGDSKLLGDSPDTRRKIRASVDAVQQVLLGEVAGGSAPRRERQDERARIAGACGAIRDVVDAHSPGEELRGLAQHRLREYVTDLLRSYHAVKTEAARVATQGRVTDPKMTLLIKQQRFVAAMAEVLDGLEEGDRIVLELGMQAIVRQLDAPNSGYRGIAESYDNLLGMRLELGVLRAFRGDPEMELLDSEGEVVRPGAGGWQVRPATPAEDVLEGFDLECTAPDGTSIKMDIKARGSFNAKANDFMPLKTTDLPPGMFAVKTVKGQGNRQQPVLVVNAEALGGLAKVQAGNGVEVNALDLIDPSRFREVLKTAIKTFTAAYPESRTAH